MDPHPPLRRLLSANFSFTLALLTAHPVISPAHQVLATSFDSEETCYIKYPDAQEIVNKIRELGVPVLFEVDAGDLEAVEEIRKMRGGFTKVVFNFPHVGQSRSWCLESLCLSSTWTHTRVSSLSCSQVSARSLNPAT
jgi:25S rRNA (uracil2634-N3)-methyltransferase